MASLSRLEAPFLDGTSETLNNYCLFLNKENKILVLHNKNARQRETIT